MKIDDAKADNIEQLVKKFFQGKLPGNKNGVEEIVKDLSQETLARFYRFQRENPGDIIRKRDAYITRVAENVWNSYLRKKKPEREHTVTTARVVADDPSEEVDLFDLIPDQDLSPEEQFVQKEGFTELYRAIDSLPSPLNQIMRMVAQDVSTQEIAHACSLTLDAVRRYRRLGVSRLRAVMGGQRPERS